MKLRSIALFLQKPFSKIVRTKQPNFVVGKNDPKGAYLRRWYLIPRNKFFNIYLHEFLRSDSDEALHDHPWWSLSLCVRGILFEQFDNTPNRKVIRVGDVVFRKAATAHRIEVTSSPMYMTALTLFITGPVVRVWGFWCASGWKSYEEFLSKPGEVGKGCAD